MKKLLTTMVLLALAGCSAGGARFDCSSEEAFKASAEQIKDSMTEAELEQLQMAMLPRLQEVALANMDKFMAGGEPEVGVHEIFADLDGKTGQEALEFLRGQ